MNLKIRVTAYVGTDRYWWDFENDEVGTFNCKEWIGTLLAKGFSDTSRRGVITYYPAHRIARITRRVI